MSDQIKVEAEIVQPKADASGTQIFELVCNWIAMTVTGYLDPRAMNPVLHDFAQAVDAVVFEYLRTDKVAAAERDLLFDIGARLSDAAHAMDPLTVDQTTGFADAEHLQDVIALAVEKLVADAMAASDLAVLATLIPLADAAHVADSISVDKTANVNDAVHQSDSGSMFQNDYVEFGYVEDDYVGTVTPF
jgi:hypothetical protein